jgi:PqqD family protein of HPr-rel-A system
MAAPSIHYRAEAAAERKIEPLDQMTLIYQRRSGITHIVTEPVPQMLSAMGDDMLTAAELLTRLSAEFELPSGDDALAAIAARLEELADLGLVERIMERVHHA